jgi:hypothetical protein
MDVNNLFMLLIDLIVVAVVCGFAFDLFRFVNPPDPWALPARAIVALILLIWVVAMFSGGVASPAHLFWHR